MSALEQVYGEGVSEALRAALPDKPKVTETPTPNGSVRVTVRWPRSEMKIDCTPERVHFAHLRSGRKNLYTELCESLPALFRERGVVEFTASPADAETAEVLMKRGEWRRGPVGLIWEL